MMLLMMMLTAQTARANDAVTYIDENGNEKSIYEYTVLTAEMAANELRGGWYVLENSDPNYTDLSLTNTLWFNGDVNLILADGADMGVAVEKGDAINVAGKLTVYGQSNQTGTLYAIGSDNGINAENGIVVNGGCVKAYGGDYKYGFNGGENGVDIHLKHYNSYILGSSYREPVTVSGLALHGQDNNGIYEGDLDKAQIENMAYQYQLLEPCYVVKFDKDNNTDPEFLAATFNKEGVAHVAKPEVPTREGYTFLEWVDKPQAESTSGVIRKRFDFTVPVKQNTYVYAKWWKNDPVQYVAYDPDEGKVVTKTVEDYTVLTPWTDVSKGLPAEWYIVVNSNEDEEDDNGVDVRITKQLDFNSVTTHIILMDDAQMVVGDDMNSAIHANVLNIYGQSIGSGKLVVNSDSWAIEAGSFNIYGGIVHAFGKLVGIYSYNTAHLYGGYVYVANGNCGLYVNKGDLILDWTRKDDGYNINGYAVFDGGSVVVADGKYFTDGEGNYYYGTLTDDETSAIAGKTLSPATQTEYIQAHFSVNGDGTEYTIHTATGWNLFCDALQDNDTYNRFIGKTVKLDADITVTSMAGSSSHDFCGTFDGNQHTLTFNYTTDENDAAPFRYVDDGCVIKDLHVCGTIQTSAKFAAGLIAHQYGNVTIRNCRSRVTINSSVSSENGDGTHGGFVAENHSTADITFEGCLFDGKLLTTGSTTTTRCGGFVGWRSNNEGAVITVTNSLYAPTALEVGEMWVSSTESATFVRNGIASDITNSYYTSDFSDGSSFTGQGKAACPATAAPIGDATHDVYTVSGITAYANGLTCGETFYYGGGENVSVSYVNESGYTVSHNCTALDPSYMPTTDLSGWYYVADDITYTDKITPGADVTFILADGKTMNIGTSESPRDGYCITGGTKDLTIYGQTNQSGTLNAYNDNKDAAAVNVSDYTQHGGNVNIDAKKYTALYPYNGNLTLTRGSLTVNGASHAIKLLSDYSATVSGGTLTATVSGTSSAIVGPLALSGTATVKVTGGIYRDVTIAAGQVFTDGNGHYYTGTLSADEKTAIDGQTLTRLTALQLADAGDNSAAIDKCNGIAFPVTLQGRTLYKDGNWNTLCLPFNVTDGDETDEFTFSGTPLEGATVMELDGATSGFDASSGTLTLNFNTANSISAGKPYIIKWASADDLVNPLFRDVTINATNSPVTSQDGKVQFRGIYSPTDIFSANHDNLFLGIGKNAQDQDVSMLFWPNTEGYTLGAFRAYFHVDLTETNGVRDIVLNFEDGTQTTGIIGHTEITETTERADAAWYSLDGRKLEGKPTKKGLHIYKGRKVVIK